MVDIDRLLVKVEQTKAKNQLMWFCGNFPTDQSVSPPVTVLEKVKKWQQVLKSGIVPMFPTIHKELAHYLKVVEPLSTPQSKQITRQPNNC